MMTSRERLMTALNNERPDRLPCQVHGWMPYYLNTYLDGVDGYAANDRFGFDHVMYVAPTYRYDPADPKRWQCRRVDLGKDKDGNACWEETIVTPGGELHHAGKANEITGWRTEYLIKTDRDFEIWNAYVPLPVAADFTAIRRAREALGDRGIVRTFPFSFGQGGPWQSYCELAGLEPSIMLAMDRPDALHERLAAILAKTLRVTDLWEGIPADMIETGGGAGSNTVISPAMFKAFCLPYDRKQHAAFRAAGLKVVYHLCGGVMEMLDLVTKNGADGLETMTPPSMGGDCRLAEASQRVGGALFFIGGFDQNAGFERGTPAEARRLVHECFEATRDHAGYIIAPSDHFFGGDPANLQAFVDACRECIY